MFKFLVILFIVTLYALITFSSYIVLDEPPIFEVYLKGLVNKTSKTIGVLRRAVLIRAALVIMSKTFVNPLLGGNDILYDKAYNNTFLEKSNHFNTMLDFI